MVQLRDVTAKGVVQIHLAATDRASRRTIELLVQDGRTRLPATQLTALAQAIAGDCDPAANGEQEQTIAERLRELAAADSTAPGCTSTGTAGG